MNNITCPGCGGQKATPINGHEYRCEYCGHTFVPSVQHSVNSQQQFVSQPQNSTQQSVQSFFETQNGIGKNKMSAGLLAIFLGAFGAHHFYLGNTGRGILYLLFCWTWIPEIMGVIEGVMILSQTDEDFAIKPKLLF